MRFRLFVAWSVHIAFSFSFFFSGYFYSVDACFVCIVSGRCNQSSFLYVVFESLYRYINAILNGSKSPSSFFSWYIQSVSSLGCRVLRIVMSFLVFWSICWSSSLIHFKNSPEYLTRGTAQVFISLLRLLLCSLVLSSFLVFWGILLLNFFHLHMFIIIIIISICIFFYTRSNLIFFTVVWVL